MSRNGVMELYLLIFFFFFFFDKQRELNKTGLTKQPKKSIHDVNNRWPKTYTKETKNTSTIN